VVKIGRTHLEDATPLTVGQEWSGYAGALDDAIGPCDAGDARDAAARHGRTAVGTGLNSPAGFGEDVAKVLARLTGNPFVTATNNSQRKARWTGCAGPWRPQGRRRHFVQDRQ